MQAPSPRPAAFIYRSILLKHMRSFITEHIIRRSGLLRTRTQQLGVCGDWRRRKDTPRRARGPVDELLPRPAGDRSSSRLLVVHDARAAAAADVAGEPARAQPDQHERRRVEDVSGGNAVPLLQRRPVRRHFFFVANDEGVHQARAPRNRRRVLAVGRRGGLRQRRYVGPAVVLVLERRVVRRRAALAGSTRFVGGSRGSVTPVLQREIRGV